MKSFSSSALASLLIVILSLRICHASIAEQDEETETSGEDDSSKENESGIFEEPLLRDDVSSDRSLFARNFNVTGILGIPGEFVAINRTYLAYGTGAVIASTLLGAAVVANLAAPAPAPAAQAPAPAPQQNVLSRLPGGLEVSTTRRKDEVKEQKCDCEAYCYETYFAGYYGEDVSGEEKRRRRR